MNTDPITALFIAHPEARRRMARATILAIRGTGGTVEDYKPFSWVMDRTSLAVVGNGTELVRVPLDSLTRRLS